MHKLTRIKLSALVANPFRDIENYPLHEDKVEALKELDKLAHDVIGAAIEVHRVLGPGFVESVYDEALCVELGLRAIPFVRQFTVRVNYKGHPVGSGRIDLLAGGALVVELKAVEALAPVHLAKVLSYLKTTGHQLGLLINFKVAKLKEGIRRVVLS